MPLCPSATLAAAPAGEGGPDGLRVIGVVGADGRVSNLRTPLAVDRAMRTELERAGMAERRFRFAAGCTEQACANWRAEGGGGHCALIGRVRAHVAASAAAPAPAAGLQPCAIRARCRWWQQDGAEACAVCTIVTYNAAEA